MTTTTNSTTEKTLIALVIQTRSYGSCYVSKELRDSLMHFDCLPESDRVYRISSYGRSIQNGGNKYKVSACDRITGKPVKTANL